MSLLYQTMSKVSAWRLAFVLGLFLAAVFGVAVYGERVLPVLAICATLTPIVNGILGASAPGERSYLERAARSALSVGWFFRFVTVVLWTGAITIATFAALRSFRTVREVSITGHVYAANGSPAAYARIEIPISNTNAICDNVGAFALTSAIDRNATDLIIRARRGGYHTDQVVRLDQASLQQRVVLTLTLPKETPPFRVMYEYLKGRAVDLFLDPPQRETWDQMLQSGSFTVRNDVFDALKDVSGRFSAPAYHTVFYVGVEPGKPVEHSTEKLANDPPNRVAFAGSNGERAYGFDEQVDVTIATEDVHNLLFGRASWSVLQRPPQSTYENHPLPETALLFRRSCELDDLVRFGKIKQTARFYAYVANTNLPPDFAWVDLSIDYSACGDTEAPKLTLTGRLMVVEVAVVENITNDTIEVGSFDFHQATTTALRPADDPLVDQPQARRESWFSPKFLRTGERIVIPMRLLLEFESDHSSDHTNDALPRVTDASSFTPEILSRFNAAPVDIVPFLANQTPSLDRKYVWGPSIALDSLQIEGITYPLRAASSRNMLVLSGNEQGSCPYFSGYSRETGWVTGGTILQGRNSIARRGTDRRILAAFDGRILLEEREQEETFIENLAVEVVTEDGHVHQLAPTIALPLKLSYGDRLEVPFRGMPKARVSRATLIATGYYLGR